MQSGKRILFVSNLGGFCSGVERFIYDSAQALRDAGFSVYALFAHIPDPTSGLLKIFERVATELEDMPDEFDMVFLHKTDNPELVRKLRHMYPVLVYVHDHDYCCPRGQKCYPFTGKYCSLPANSFHCRLCSPIVKKPGGGIALMQWSRFEQLRNEIRNCHAFAVASDFMHNELVHDKFEKEKIHKLFPICGVPEVPDWKGSCETIIYVGQLLKSKGVDLFLNALSKLSSPWRAVIVGARHGGNDLKALAAKLDIAHRITFTGWVDDPSDYFRRAGISVFPSRWQEPFGIAGLEAMRHSLPVVGFNVGGVGEWLKDGKNGISVPPEDVDGMADALSQLLEERNLARQLGENGRGFAAAFDKNRFLHSFGRISSEMAV